MNAMAISFWISFVILCAGTGACIWLHVKKKAGRPVLTMTAIVTIGLSLIVLRIFHYSQGSVGVWERVLLSVMDSIRYFAMGKSFAEIDDLDVSQIYQAYYSLEVFLSVLAPLCTATVLASVLHTIFDQARLYWNNVCPVYYFSELNERSLTLATDLKKQATADSGKKTKIKMIFCKGSVPSPLRTEAQALGAIMVNEPIHLITLPDAAVRQVRVFLIDDEDENNIQTFLKMQGQLCNAKNTGSQPHPESDFFVFSTRESDELIYDEAVKHLNKETLAYDLHLINETRQITQKLLLDHPLYEAAALCGNPDRISVLVVGCGYLGTQFLKNAMICGMMDSYHFNIQVIDDQADWLKHQFLHDHPFLSKPSDVFPADPGEDIPRIVPTFLRANVRSNDFDHILEQYCTKSNYIVVATGDDQLNLTTAEFLRRWYTQRVLRGQETENVNPLIFAAVRDPQRNKGLASLEGATGYCGKLHLFANNMDIYSLRWLLERPLDNAAAMLNRCYEEKDTVRRTALMLDSWKDEVSRDNKRKLLLLDVMSQRSNQIAALHSLYKLQDLLHWSQKEGREKDERIFSLCDCTGPEAVHSFFRFAELNIKQRKAVPDLEHRRWTLFYALNGWECYEDEKLFAWLSGTKKDTITLDKPHKSTAAKLHGCMILTDRLDDFSKALAEHLKTPENPNPTARDFIENDRTVCRASLFAWLMLTADEETAEALTSALRNQLERHKKQDTLDWLCQVGETVEDRIPSNV